LLAIAGIAGTLNPVNLRLQTDYALRVLLYLAQCGEQRSVERIATDYHVSRDHLFKVVQQLSRLGYVTSRGGRGGGVKLAKEPADINVGTVVAEVEGRNGVLSCVHDPNACVLEPGCILRNLVIKAEDAFFATLSKMTIADVVRANTQARTGGLYNLTIKAHEQKKQQLFPPTSLSSGAMSRPAAPAGERSAGEGRNDSVMSTQPEPST
jgi:Rrf2 family nitric oxide-sensitive transcriptional repressor